MSERLPFTFQNLGDSALLIGFDNRMDPLINENVLECFHLLCSARQGVITDLVPGYCSLGVVYDLDAALKLPGEGTAYEKMTEMVKYILTVRHNRKVVAPREHLVPVCYEPEYAPDLMLIAGAGGLTADDLISIHISRTYTVYMIGFLPGFAYMGEVDERIAYPRKDSPRTTVPAGAVGIAGKQTGIYPSASPGGWQLIGQTPLVLFDRHRQQPAFFKPGDQVRFYPISAHEYKNY